MPLADAPFYHYIIMAVGWPSIALYVLVLLSIVKVSIFTAEKTPDPFPGSQISARVRIALLHDDSGAGLFRKALSI